jgi:hypothetical protein
MERPPTEAQASEAAAAIGLANAATYAVATSPMIRPMRRMGDADSAEAEAVARAEQRALAQRRAQNVCQLPSSMALLSSDSEGDDEPDVLAIHTSPASLRPQERSLSSTAGDALGTILAASRSPLLQAMTEAMREPPMVKLESDDVASLSVASAATVSRSFASPAMPAVRAPPSPSPSPTSNSILAQFASVTPFVAAASSGSLAHTHLHAHAAASHMEDVQSDAAAAPAASNSSTVTSRAPSSAARLAPAIQSAAVLTLVPAPNSDGEDDDGHSHGLHELEDDSHDAPMGQAQHVLV